MNKMLVSRITSNLSLDEYARWAALIEAVDFIKEKAKQRNIDLDKNARMIKPKAINKYIQSRFHSIKHDLKSEIKLSNLSNRVIK